MPARLHSLLRRLAGGLQLRLTDAAIVFVLFQIVVTIGMGLQLFYPFGTQHPFFIDPLWAERGFAVQSWIVVPGNIALLVVGLLVRGRWPDSRVLAHAAMQSVFLVCVWGCYLTGFYTFVFGIGAMIGLTVIGLLLFDASIVRAGVITFVLGLAAMTVAEQMGVLPYAPLFAVQPIVGGHLDTGYLLSLAVPQVAPGLIGVFFLIAGAERLRRATALIRRYVPTQLADKILAGEHTGAAQPERRKVTLFFSDVVGFTPAADQMEPEDLASLLNEYLGEMSEIAAAFGATLNQFVGDGIMIFFGAPEATNDQDHAIRAVRMSLAMQRRMSELGEKWFAEGIQTPFRIRIGINTGVASIGDFGSEGRTTYSAIGNQTNLTARIQAHCEPGKVLMSHTTWALVKDQIPSEERGEIAVKGLHYPVRIYEVVAEAANGGDA